MTPEQKAKHEAVRAVECPRCNAKAGEPCKLMYEGSSGQPMNVHHGMRYELARSTPRWPKH